MASNHRYNHNHATNGIDSKPKTKKPKLSSPFITDSEIQFEFAHHDPKIVRVNNGSFGCCPASVSAAQRQWQLKFLRQPDHFYFFELRKGILHSRSIVKTLINADHVDEISLVDNATTAAAIVFQQTAQGFIDGRYNKGDAAVILHYAYGSVKKSIEVYITRAGGQVFEVQLPFPVKSKDEIVAEFRKALMKGKANGRRVRLAVIDHITSMPCVVTPIKELVKICREEEVDQVFVDAAHAIGCTDVDMKEIGADFYTSNLHKWFFCPPTVAFLYCKKSTKCNDMHHPVVSHEYGNGLPIETAAAGTRDFSAQLVIPSVLEFVNRFEGGIEGIKKRNHDAVVEMGQMLADAWKTSLGCPPEMCASLIMVGLPACLGVRDAPDAWKLRTHLRNKFNVEVPMYYRQPKYGEVDPITGYARISYQVYNKVEDYYTLRDAINQLVSEGFTCSLLPD